MKKITFLLSPETNLLDWLQVFEPLLRLQQLGDEGDWQWVYASSSELPEATQAALCALGVSLQPIDPTGVSDIVAAAGQPSISAGISLCSRYSDATVRIVASGQSEPASAGKISESRLTGNLWQNLERLQKGMAKADAKRPLLLISADAGSARAAGLALCALLADEDACRIVAEKMGVNLPERTAAAGERTAEIKRDTNETRVQVRVSVDGSGRHTIQTGLPFLDHMLTQVAVHGLFDLDIQAQGDLEVDAHHTVEDVALTLGKAFDQALGERRGLVRMASTSVPMDESLAMVSLDLSGRPYTVFEVDWVATEVGGISTTLIKHFFESFAVQARCNLHIRLLSGGDDHHRAEAIFKAFGRALDAATRIDPRRVDTLPSSKGAL
jgi:imidazoleglycerol-phosphate dehydratase